MSAYLPSSATLMVGNEPERVDVLHMNASFFQLLGIRLIIGRTFLAAEDQPGARKVAVPDFRLWDTRFGRDPNIIGKTISLDGENPVVTGVLPRRFAFPNRPVDLYIPIAHSTATGTPEAPRAGAPRELHVKLRMPRQHPVKSTTVNSRSMPLGGPYGDTVIFPTGSGRNFEIAGQT
jgi:hypothetical protein